MKKPRGVVTLGAQREALPIGSVVMWHGQLYVTCEGGPKLLEEELARLRGIERAVLGKWKAPLRVAILRAWTDAIRLQRKHDTALSTWGDAIADALESSNG